MAAKPVIKVNSNPNPTPAKSMKGSTDSSMQNRGPSKYDWGHNAWNSKEGTGPYGEPTYNSKAPINPIKVNSNPKPLNESQRLEDNFNGWARSQPSAQKNTLKETKTINSNPVPTRTSPSLSQDGRLGGAHAGGHGISEEEMFAGKGPSKLGGLGALGARIARATEGEVPLP
jgi:hypothetical protein